MTSTKLLESIFPYPRACPKTQDKKFLIFALKDGGKENKL
jgi:hypothetical protein